MTLAECKDSLLFGMAVWLISLLFLFSFFNHFFMDSYVPVVLPNPMGVDRLIQGLQVRLYNRLLQVWGVSAEEYRCYGRAYRNRTNDGYIPEFYDAEKGCYVASDGSGNQGGLFYDDRLAAVSFFGLADPVTVKGGVSVARMQLMFFVNLDRITPGGIADAQGQRLDDIAVQDVQNYIQSNGNNFTVTAVYKDIDKVLERYSGALKNRALRDNMHPRLCFRLDLELRYISLNS